MTDFTITLDGVEYKCVSTSGTKDDKSWNISVKHGNVSTGISIPMENKITRAKALLFIEALHVAMHEAFDAQQIDQNYIWNRKSTIV